MTQPEAVALGKSRSDCTPKDIDALLRRVVETSSITGSIVECGAYKCGATIAMAASTDRTVYTLDLFGGLPYPGQQHFTVFGDTDFGEILGATKDFKNIVFISGRHESTVPDLPEFPISLIFMDSDFYSSHEVCLRTFWPRLSSGGEIVFHDWDFGGVQQAIHETIPAGECDHFGVMEDSPNMGLIRKC